MQQIYIKRCLNKLLRRVHLYSFPLSFRVIFSSGPLSNLENCKKMIDARSENTRKREISHIENIKKSLELPLYSEEMNDYLLKFQHHYVKYLPYRKIIRTNFNDKFKVLEFPAATKDLDFYIVKDLLTAKECKSVLNVAEKENPKCVKISDRHKELDYIHEVWRFEDVFINDPETYPIFCKLCDVVELIDYRYWKKLRKFDHIYPETEYITYDCTKPIDDPKKYPYVG
eukprot:UN27627